MEKEFYYSIMRNGKYLNTEYRKRDTVKLSEAIKIYTEVELNEYWNSQYIEDCKKQYDMKVVKVECTPTVYDIDAIKLEKIKSQYTPVYDNSGNLIVSCKEEVPESFSGDVIINHKNGSASAYIVTDDGRFHTLRG